MMEFFLPIIPPTTTHQQKQVTVRNGKPVFYEPEDLKAARAKLMAHLSQHKPTSPFVDPVRLIVKWCFKNTGSHKNGEYKVTKPDLDNSNKLLQDCLTKLDFWNDDSQVVSLITEKFWADVPGIYIKIEAI
jgi:Holliday junction resolvase RusA-like endonuclease